MGAMTLREFGAPSGMELVDLPAPKPTRSSSRPTLWGSGVLTR